MEYYEVPRVWREKHVFYYFITFYFRVFQLCTLWRCSPSTESTKSVQKLIIYCWAGPSSYICFSLLNFNPDFLLLAEAGSLLNQVATLRLFPQYTSVRIHFRLCLYPQNSPSYAASVCIPSIVLKGCFKGRGWFSLIALITDAFMTIASLSDEASKTDEHRDRQTQTKPDTAKSRERSTGGEEIKKRRQ